MSPSFRSARPGSPEVGGMSSAQVVPESPAAGDWRARLRAIAGTSAGNALEWYDWNTYAVFAPFFAKQFFNPQDSVSALLSTLAVFAVGFAMRPLGGYLFGLMADRRGRRISMLLSVGLAASSSMLIGLAPSYATVGVVASVLLMSARLMQGLAHGGEIAASHTYIAEIAPARRRGLWSSSIYVSGMSATLLATVLAAAMNIVLSTDAMSGWGWRVPFLLGGIFGIVVLSLRRTLNESQAFERHRSTGEAAPTRTSPWRGLWEHRRAALRVAGLTLGGTVFFYTWSVAAPTYAISSKRMDPSTALWAGVTAILILIGVLPFAGALSDRIGRRPNFLIFSVGAAALSFPLNRLIRGEFWQLALAMSVALILTALVVSILPALFAELFPTHIRAAGIGIPYSISVAIAGGTAPYLQHWLSEQHHGDVFLWYTIALLLIGATVIVVTPETRAKPLT